MSKGRKRSFSVRKYSKKSTMGSRAKTNAAKVSRSHYRSNRPNQGIPGNTVNR